MGLERRTKSVRALCGARPDDLGMVATVLLGAMYLAAILFSGCMPSP